MNKPYLCGANLLKKRDLQKQTPKKRTFTSENCTPEALSPTLSRVR